MVAQTGEFRLVILAPGTDAEGARRLVARLQRELDATATKAPLAAEFPLRVGYCAVPDFAAAKLDMRELVQRAESALDQVPNGAEGPSRVMSFDQLSVA